MRSLAALVVVLAAAGCSAANPLGRPLDGASGNDAGGASTQGGNNGDDGNGSGDDGNSSGGQPPSPLFDASTPVGPLPQHDGGTGAPLPGDAGSAALDAAQPAPLDGGLSNDAVLQHCADGVNSLRTQAGLTPYARSAAIEAFGALAAASDAQSGQTHGYFNQTSGGGVSSAESELPGYPLDGSSFDGVIDQGMSQIAAEGQGGTHYDMVTSQTYTQVGCGYATAPDGTAWVTLDFH